MYNIKCIREIYFIEININNQFNNTFIIEPILTFIPLDRVKNVTVYPEKNKTLIEFENNKELIDNCIISNEIYDKFKSNDPLYNITVKDYSKLSNLSAKENYNINKSLQLKLVKEDDSYTDYYAMTCGFKNKKELMKYTKAVIKFANKVK